MGLLSRVSGMRVRLRLTLVYGLLFVLCGAVLQAITYVLMESSSATVIMHDRDASGVDDVVLGVSMPAGYDPSSTTDAGHGLSEELQRQLGSQQDTIMHALMVRSIISLAVMAIIAMALGWLVAGRVLRPVRTMTDSIRRISARNVHERLAVPGHRDELKDLADTVDGLLGRLEAALDSHQRFVANAAHELRTPLTLEHALLEETVIDPGATADEFRAQFQQLMLVSEQQARLLESLLVLATSERGLDHREDVDLAGVARTVLLATPAPDVTVVADVARAPVSGDPVLLERLVANLVGNALAYNVPDGRVEVMTGAEDGHCFLSVSNTGPPVPAHMVDKLLSPFQRMARTADDGHHGLGLSIVRAIAVAHGSELAVRARPAGGLAVTVRFAAAEKKTDEGEQSSAEGVFVPVV
jgi:signal transduction histidine kinase